MEKLGCAQQETSPDQQPLMVLKGACELLENKRYCHRHPATKLVTYASNPLVTYTGATVAHMLWE